MTPTPSIRSDALRLAAGLALALLASPGCDDAPTTAVVANGYPVAGDVADTMTVFKVWWAPTLFPDPVPPGEASETERTIPGSDFAYALLAPGWSAESATPPPRLVALKSTRALTAVAHERLAIPVSDDAFTGNCAAGSTLAEADARLIAERIFPGDFAGASYDPATCTSTPAPPDAGP
jgi:hypothetical protein